MKNKIIFLNGLTSAGKTSVSRAMMDISIEDIFYFSNDIFQNNASIKSAGDNYFMHLAESINAMYHAVSAISKTGYNCIVDGMLLDLDEFRIKFGLSHYDLVKSILKRENIYLVHIDCPLEECEKRNRIRGDRTEGQSTWQSDNMSSGIEYDLTVDSYANPIEKCAKDILNNMI